MKLLDLFCGAGGCAVGYHRAGFTEIVGVDNRPMPRYPFSFVQADALEFLAQVQPGEYDLIHASPPCQAHSKGSKMRGTAHLHEDLIPETRRLLQALGTPYVIENVVGAPLAHHVELCGVMFGLGVLRHRRFETSHLLFQPPHPSHCGRVSDGAYVTVAGNGADSRDFRLSTWRRAMGIGWMEKRELCQAIPPAYTQWIGRQMIGALA